MFRYTWLMDSRLQTGLKYVFHIMISSVSLQSYADNLVLSFISLIQVNQSKLKIIQVICKHSCNYLSI